MPQVNAAYREHAKRKRYSPRTIESTLRLLRRLRAFGVEPLRATSADLERYLDSRRLSSQSMLTNLAAFSAFYRWALDAGLVDVNPVARIVRPRKNRYHPRPASSRDLSMAVELAPPQLRVMLLLAAFAGFRCMEIAGLRWSEVDLGAAIVNVYGKGGHERLVDLHPAVVAELAALPRQGAHVFIGLRHGGNQLGGEHQPYTAARVSSTINRFLHSIGIQSSAHQLRHWYGTELYRSTKDLRMVQELMGHASPATTAIYTAFDRTEKQRATAELSFGGQIVTQPALW